MFLCCALWEAWLHSQGFISHDEAHRFVSSDKLTASASDSYCGTQGLSYCAVLCHLGSPFRPDYNLDCSSKSSLTSYGCNNINRPSPSRRQQDCHNMEAPGYLQYINNSEQLPHPPTGNIKSEPSGNLMKMASEREQMSDPSCCLGTVGQRQSIPLDDLCLDHG